MARQKGLFKVIGTIGDVNFYVIKGVGYARKAGGGFNGDAIRHKPSMQRVRENASEFGHCSQVKKAFRLALMPFLHGYTSGKLHARMMTLFTSIKTLDGVSERGKRCVGLGLETAKGKRLLQHFVFTPFNSVLDALKSCASFNWSSQLLTVTNFKPDFKNAPKTATHIGITLGVLDFDFNSLEYALEVSPTHFLERGTRAFDFVLTPETLVIPEHTGVVVLGLRFYEVIDGEVYSLDSLIGVCLL